MKKRLHPIKYTIILVAALVVPGISVFGYNLYIDPFQIIHKDLKKPYIILGGRGTDRYQHAGIINNFPVQSIILGNSHAANYLPSKLEKELKVKNAFSLTMDGASLAEQVFPARYALKNRDVGYVLWGISYTFLSRNPDMRNIKMSLPEFLYDDSRLNDFQFFVTFDLQKYYGRKTARRKRLLKSDKLNWTQQREFDRATSWYWNARDHFNRPLFVADKILKKQKLVYSPRQIEQLDLSPEHLYQQALGSTSIKRKLENNINNIQRHILTLVRNRPHVKFDFVYTPFPILRSQYEKIYRKDLYLASLFVLKNFVTLTADMPNVRVFAFGTDSFTNRLELYKDPGHFHIGVNHHILRAMGRNKNIITTENIDSYIRSFDNKTSRYRLPSKWNPSFHDAISSEGKPISIKAARRLILSNNH